MSPRTSEPNARPYAAAVPAVRRAMATLEAVAAQPGGLTMAEASRALRLSPSSALAILRTLEQQGYLWQDAETRRYRVGLPLLALGRRAGQTLPPLAAFGQVASALARQLGETISLWALQGADACLLAAAEGPRSVRFAPQPGLRWPAASSAAGQAMLARLDPSELADWQAQGGRSGSTGQAPSLAELDDRLQAVRRQGYAEDRGATEAGLYVLALAIDGAWRGARLALAYAAPAGPAPPATVDRLVAALRQAAVSLAHVVPATEADQADDRPATERPPIWRPDAAGPMGAAELRAFLDGPWLATLSCLKENGYPYSVPVWYQWDDGRFWVVPRARAEWARYLALDPRVSLTIGEPQPPLRRALVEGRAEPLEATSSQDHVAQLVARMAARYLGPAATGYLEASASQPRRAFAIVPERLVTWRGLAPHPRYVSQTGRALLPESGAANA